MKLLDFILNFNKKNNPKSLAFCRVRYFLLDLKHVVIITDLGKLNFGQSITNAIESIITELYEQGFLVEKNPIFIEHYERDDYKEDTFDIVLLNPKTHWQTISKSEVLSLIGSLNFSDLVLNSFENSHIVDQVKKICLQKSPFFDSLYMPSNNFIKKKLEIKEKMINKQDLINLVNNNSNEQEIQKLLKQDLSIFAEAYTDNEEYICFSEFPLSEGSVDFVVFSGRSRMDVILIEVKGANFNLVNSDHYKSFNAHINKAAAQIELRLGKIYRDLSSFRSHFHEIRRQAEKGEQIYNALVGPSGELLVDPNKDINIRTVIIGGKTKDDLLESRIRQDYESSRTPPIRVESWDTFIRRLKR